MLGLHFIAREIQKLYSSIQVTTAPPAPGKQGKTLRGSFPTQFSADLSSQIEFFSRRAKHLSHSAPERDKRLSKFGFQTFPNPCRGFLPSGMLIYNCTWRFNWISGRKVPSAPNASQKRHNKPQTPSPGTHMCCQAPPCSAEPVLLLQPHLCQVLCYS